MNLTDIIQNKSAEQVMTKNPTFVDKNTVSWGGNKYNE